MALRIKTNPSFSWQYRMSLKDEVGGPGQTEIVLDSVFSEPGLCISKSQKREKRGVVNVLLYQQTHTPRICPRCRPIKRRGYNLLQGWGACCHLFSLPVDRIVLFGSTVFPVIVTGLAGFHGKALKSYRPWTQLLCQVLLPRLAF